MCEATKVPTHFLCPLTKEVMMEPVTTTEGHSFERTALLRHLANKGRSCPITGNKIHLSDVVENGILALEIEQWKQELQGPPLSFICPITKQIMKDPVTTPSGNFEKQALLRHLANNNSTCPITGDKMLLSEVTDNGVMAHKIECWRSQHPETVVEPELPGETETVSAETRTETTIQSKASEARNHVVVIPSKLSEQKMTPPITLALAQHLASSDADFAEAASEPEDIIHLIDEVRTVLQN